MDTLTFIDAMTGKIAWPIIVLLIAVLYRRSIIKLIGALTKLKVGDAELEFQTAVIEAKEVVKNINQTVIIPDDIKSTLSVNPRMAVVDAFVKFENAVMAKATILNISTSEKRRVKDVFWEMNSMGYVDLSDLDLFSRLYHIRNTVVHGGPFSGHIEKTDAAICINLIFGLIDKVNGIPLIKGKA